jgi:hypothetical protein
VRFTAQGNLAVLSRMLSGARYFVLALASGLAAPPDVRIFTVVQKPLC